MHILANTLGPKAIPLVENNSQLADKNSKEFCCYGVVHSKKAKNCLLLACLFHIKHLKQNPQYPSRLEPTDTSGDSD